MGIMTVKVGEELNGMYFDPAKPYRCCCICGAVYQSVLDRAATQESQFRQAQLMRNRWAERHARQHTQKEHDELRKSGNQVTPEAALKLVPYGILPIKDLVLSDDHAQAGLEAPRMPRNDAEG